MPSRTPLIHVDVMDSLARIETKNLIGLAILWSPMSAKGKEKSIRIVHCLLHPRVEKIFRDRYRSLVGKGNGCHTSLIDDIGA